MGDWIVTIARVKLGKANTRSPPLTLDVTDEVFKNTLHYDALCTAPITFPELDEMRCIEWLRQILTKTEFLDRDKHPIKCDFICCLSDQIATSTCIDG
eukprot:1820970-Karenia_brevis.AAC.1